MQSNSVQPKPSLVPFTHSLKPDKLIDLTDLPDEAAVATFLATRFYELDLASVEFSGLVTEGAGRGAEIEVSLYDDDGDVVSSVSFEAPFACTLHVQPKGEKKMRECIGRDIFGDATRAYRTALNLPEGYPVYGSAEVDDEQGLVLTLRPWR